MRTLRKNQQELKYSVQIAEIPEYDTDYYEDDDGERYPIDVRPTGKTEIVYGKSVDFFASISMSGGEAEAVEYGLSTESYAAVMITEKNLLPIKEGALIWHTSEPELKHIEVEIDDVAINGDYPIRESADYIVMKKSPSINVDKYILTAINK